MQAGRILIHSHQMAITVLTAVIFFIRQSKEKELSVPLTKQADITYFKKFLWHTS